LKFSTGSNEIFITDTHSYKHCTGGLLLWFIFFLADCLEQRFRSRNL